MTLTYKDACASKHHYQLATRVIHSDPQRAAFEIVHGIRRATLRTHCRGGLPDICPEGAVVVTVSNGWHLHISRAVRHACTLPRQLVSHLLLKAKTILNDDKKWAQKRQETIG